MGRWTGKLLGVVVGVALLRSGPLLGALLGLLIGHAFDAGWFRARPDDPYRFFGLDADATDADVDLAYRRLMARCHPDRLATADDARRREAEADAREINAAYERVKAMRRRR